jgi:hypothetical protein
VLIVQYHVRNETARVTDKDIADPSVPGKITEKGVRENVSAYVFRFAVAPADITVHFLTVPPGSPATVAYPSTT